MRTEKSLLKKNNKHFLEYIIDNLKKYSLIFMDIHLPDSDGYELSKLIKEKYDMPIIAVTADESAKNKWHEYMDGFIIKPFSSKKLNKYLDDLN